MAGLCVNRPPYPGDLLSVHLRPASLSPRSMLACEHKFAEEAAEWAAKLREADRAWQERIGEMQQTWGEGGADSFTMLEDKPCSVH